MSRSVRQDYTALIERSHPKPTVREKNLAFIRATLAESNASQAFRLEATAENLTAWADAKHHLETLKEEL